MIIYGLKIGDVGLEFASRGDRERAIIVFTRASTRKVSSVGIKFEDHTAAFSTYERDPKIVVVTCCGCRGEFSIDSTPERDYPYKNYANKWVVNRGFFCDGCLATANRAKEVDDAKRTLEGQNGVAV